MFVDTARRLWNRARSAVDPDDRPASAAAGAADPSTPPTPSSTLFECSDCGAVYIATEKDRCGSCRASVDEVRQTVAAR